MSGTRAALHVTGTCVETAAKPFCCHVALNRGQECSPAWHWPLVYPLYSILQQVIRSYKHTDRANVDHSCLSDRPGAHPCKQQHSISTAAAATASVDIMDGHDTTFLITSAFSVDSGIRPKAVYRNLAPAELYEMVRADI